MPNFKNFSNIINKNNLKKSSGSNSVTNSQLEKSQFLPKIIVQEDQGENLTTQLVTQQPSPEPFDNFLLNSQTSGVSQESLFLQNFVSLDSVFNPADNTVLNRATTGQQLQLSTNLSSVESQSTSRIAKTSMPSVSVPAVNTFQNNILDGFENVTYNFKLMMAPENTLLNTAQEPTGQMFTIAQSGVTSTFNIKDVEIESVVGPNGRTKNTQSTIFRLSIEEPQGISLIDKILQAGARLGISNIMNAPIILELTFRGYDPNSGQKQELNIAKRTWRIQLIDIQTQMDVGGSLYVLSFVNVNDYGFHRLSSASVIKQQISFPVEKVGDFFDSLGYRLTLQDALLAANGVQTRNEYEFILDPEIREWVVGDSKDEPNAPSMFIDEDGKRSVLLKPGHKLEDIVDNVLATTKEANEKANPNSPSNKMDKSQAGSNVSKIVNISCEVEYLGYNTNNNEYIRKYIYYINLYDAFRALADEPQNARQNERIQYLLEDALQKKYSYIFSGENTEVLNLNLELNNLWRHAVSYYTHALHRNNNISSDFKAAENRDIGRIDDITSERQQLNYTPIPGSTDDILNRFSGSSDFESQYTPIPDQSTPNPRKQLSDRLQRLRDSGFDNTVALEETIASLDTADEIVPVEGSSFASQSVTQVTGNSVGGRLSSTSKISSQILEDTGTQERLGAERQTRSAVANNLLETLPSDFKPEKFNSLNNLFIRQNDPAIDVSRVNENIEETKDFGRSIFGIIANQMYSSTYSDLLEIELEIRGDPFWLGETDSESIRRLRSFRTRETSGKTFANYLRGENSFFLTFNTPRGYNENTGFVDIKESTTFVGVYNVISVIHSFTEGRFTQRLTAVRDLNTNADILKRMVR